MQAITTPHVTTAKPSVEDAPRAAAPSVEDAPRTAQPPVDDAPWAAEPYVSHQGEAVWYGDSLFEFLVPSAATGGAMSVLRATLAEGFGPPRHIHTREDEVFLVVEGDVLFEIDGRRRLAGPGTSVWMPRGVPHTFRVRSPVAVLIGVMTPGHFEELFHNLSVPAARRALPEPGAAPLDIPTVMAEQRRLGTEVVGPPLTAQEA